MSKDKLLKPAEVAETLNISTDKVIQMVNNKTLRGIRLGPRTIRIFQGSLNELLARAGSKGSQEHANDK